jgi:SAM-dependent methyltransferase
MPARTKLTGVAAPGAAGHACPPWIARILASPLRRLLVNPDREVARYVRPGMRALDVGCGLGFYTIPLARLVGPTGRVHAVDVWPEVVAELERRARRAGYAARVEVRLCRGDDLDLADLGGRVDFALAMHVVHEAPDPEAFLAQVHAAVTPGGRLLMVEPRGHVGPSRFARTHELAEGVGFRRLAEPRIRLSRAVLLDKPADDATTAATSGRAGARGDPAGGRDASAPTEAPRD